MYQGQQAWTTNPMNYYAQCNALNISTAAVAAMGQFMPVGGTWYSGHTSCTGYTHVMPPNALSCEFDNNGFQPDGALTASSRHAGGINVMMMDGSVRFAKSTINIATWQAIGSMSGNEVISSDAFLTALSDPSWDPLFAAGGGWPGSAVLRNPGLRVA